MERKLCGELDVGSGHSEIELYPFLQKWLL